MFSENWLEKHGNASFQDFWVTPELDGYLPNRQESFTERFHRQDQAGGKQDTLAAICQPNHHLKFQKGDDEERSWCHKLSEEEEVGMKTETPRWNLLNFSIE